MLLRMAAKLAALITLSHHKPTMLTPTTGLLTGAGNKCPGLPVYSPGAGKYTQKGTRMKAGFGVIASLAVLALTNPGQSQSVREPAFSDRPIAFQDISVIPMDTERILSHQTVLVRSGKITDVGPTISVHLPPVTVVIAGREKFLMTGMADMHTHVDR